MFGLQLLQRAEPDRDEHRVAELGDRRERVGAVRRDADLGPRLLVRLRGHRDVVEAVILALVRKPVLGPGLFQDFERLGEAVAAFAVRHAIGLVGAREAAATDAEDQPAVADLIDRRDLLGEAQRMAQRQHLDRGADLHPLGAGGDRAGQGQRRRQHRTLRRDMDLGQPHRVEAPALGRVDLLERGRERLLVADPGRPLKFVKHAELETHRLPPSSRHPRPAAGRDAMSRAPCRTRDSSGHLPWRELNGCVRIFASKENAPRMRRQQGDCGRRGVHTRTPAACSVRR